MKAVSFLYTGGAMLYFRKEDTCPEISLWILNPQ